MVTTRGKRTLISDGLYSDAIGLSAVVKVGKRQKEKRFPRGTSLKEIRDWQTAVRAALTKTRRKASGPVGRGTFASDVERFLTTVTKRPSYGSAQACLNAWAEAFGDRRRVTISLAEYQAVMDGWERTEDHPDARFAGSTLNHCKDWLVQLYRTLDECDDADNVATKLRRHAQAPPEPRAIPDDIVDEILNAMLPSIARAYCKVLAHVGMPPARQRRLKPTQLDLKNKTVFLVRRRKGGGTEEKTFSLSRKGVAAFEEFVALNAWGGVTKESIYTCFLRGVAAANRKRAKEGKPLIPPLRPYDLRHTFGAKVYRKTGDIGAAAEMLDVTLETARRYTLSAIPDRIAKAVEALDGEATPPAPESQPKEPAKPALLQIVSRR
jgi:integrase